MDSFPERHILVFLPPAAAQLIVARMRDSGYRASIACSVPDLHHCLGTTDYCLVVSKRPDIDTVRDLKPLPVVSLEIFFHSDSRGAQSTTGAKQFDAEAFLGRVRALTEPRQEKEQSVVRKTWPELPGHWLWRLLPIRRLKYGRGTSAVRRHEKVVA